MSLIEWVMTAAAAVVVLFSIAKGKRLISDGPDDNSALPPVVIGKESQRVVVTDVQMPFFSMVFFMVKWAIAAIPALIILGVFAVFGFTLIGLPFAR